MKCQECDINLEGRRKGSLFCSDACRMKHRRGGKVIKANINSDNPDINPDILSDNPNKANINVRDNSNKSDKSVRDIKSDIDNDDRDQTIRDFVLRGGGRSVHYWGRGEKSLSIN